MSHYSLLISPEARSAYFADYLDVAQRELLQVTACSNVVFRSRGGLDFIDVECDESLLAGMLRLSFVQGIFAREGDHLLPLDIADGFLFNDALVFGAKYRGKTNERLRQMLVNVGLAAIGAKDPSHCKLLDPMCGRGTTLLWSLRYGMKARGVEREPRVQEDLRRDLRRWCKLHRQKHQLSEGSVGKRSRKAGGRFLEFNSEGVGLKLVNGDAREAPELLGGEKFDLLVSDLPYGVQHDTVGGTRNPLGILAECAAPWRECLKPGGALVLAFNRYQPKRPALIEAFESAGWQADSFSAPHRMSEAIVRDVVVFR